jgi:hypothetical protein
MVPINLWNVWQLNPYIRKFDDERFYQWNYWFLVDDYYNKIKEKQTTEGNYATER